MSLPGKFQRGRWECLDYRDGSPRKGHGIIEFNREQALENERDGLEDGNTQRAAAQAGDGDDVEDMPAQKNQNSRPNSSSSPSGAFDTPARKLGTVLAAVSPGLALASTAHTVLVAASFAEETLSHVRLPSGHMKLHSRASSGFRAKHTVNTRGRCLPRIRGSAEAEQRGRRFGCGQTSDANAQPVHTRHRDTDCSCPCSTKFPIGCFSCEEVD